MLVDILNYLGEKIGEASFPQGTSQEEIDAELAAYARPPVVEIAEVTPRQIRQAWIRMGHQLSEIDEAIAMLPSPYKELAQVEWEYSTVVQRNNQLVAMLGESQGFTSGQLDQLWIFAKSL